jgi:predicted RNase H-like nuclease (RuvC/YqgF family)
MGRYQGCKLTVEVPTSCDERAVRKALVDEFPGIEVVVHVGPALRTTQAVVPDKHSLAGMAERVGLGPGVRTGERALLKMSDEVLRRFNA